MTDRIQEHGDFVAGVLAFFVAGIHLYWGIPRFTAYASIGAMPDPRPAAFVLSGHAIVVAVTLVVAGILDARRTYLPGIVLMLVHLVGYVAWHTVYSHGIGSTGTESGHIHSPLGFSGIAIDVYGHLVNSPLALSAKTTEFGLLILLSILFIHAERE